jgi:hypothetical protein
LETLLVDVISAKQDRDLYAVEDCAQSFHNDQFDLVWCGQVLQISKGNIKGLNREELPFFLGEGVRAVGERISSKLSLEGAAPAPTTRERAVAGFVVSCKNGTCFFLFRAL